MHSMLPSPPQPRTLITAPTVIMAPHLMEKDTEAGRSQLQRQKSWVPAKAPPRHP